MGLRESGRRGTGEEGKQTAKTQFFFRLDERNGKIDVGSRVRRGTFKEDFFLAGGNYSVFSACGNDPVERGT